MIKQIFDDKIILIELKIIRKMPICLSSEAPYFLGYPEIHEPYEIPMINM